MNFPFSAFCRRFLLWTSIGLNTIHTFLSPKNPQTDTFLCEWGFAKLRSTARVWNHQGISKPMNRLIVACQMTASSRFAHINSAGLPRYEILCSGIFKVPLPYGMHLKVSHKGCHIFEQLRPQQHRSAVDEMGNSWGWSLSVPFLRLWGSGASSIPFKVLLLLCIVIHFHYCLCTWLPRRMKNAGANTSNETGCLWTQLLVNKKKEFLVEECRKVFLEGSSLVKFFLDFLR